MNYQRLADGYSTFIFVASKIKLTEFHVILSILISKLGFLSQRKPEIIIATPGRLWELMKVENHLDAISYCDMLVIDETDRMIEKGHFEELSSIIHHMNKVILPI